MLKDDSWVVIIEECWSAQILPDPGGKLAGLQNPHEATRRPDQNLAQIKSHFWSPHLDHSGCLLQVLSARQSDQGHDGKQKKL